MEKDKAALSQEPDYEWPKCKACGGNLWKCMVCHPDAAAQIATLEKQVGMYWDVIQTNVEQIAQLQASLNAAQNVADDSFKQVFQLQAENAELQRQLSDMHTKHPEDACYDIPTWNKLKDRIKELEAATRMALSALEEVNEMADDYENTIDALRDALGEK